MGSLSIIVSKIYNFFAQIVTARRRHGVAKTLGSSFYWQKRLALDQEFVGSIPTSPVGRIGVRIPVPQLEYR